MSIIKTVHESNGHFKSDKLETQLKRDYDISHLKDKIDKVLNNCMACLVADRKRGKIYGILHPIPKEDLPLQTLHYVPIDNYGQALSA